MNQDFKEFQRHDNKFNVITIPFSYRKSPLLSISFRSFDLEMQQFKIKIESDGDSNLQTPIISKFSETTMVPKFQIDYNNKEINYLNTTTYSKYIISLLGQDEKELMKFNLNLFELSFLGKELYNVSINHFPMLILEFMDGYYTTNELFQKNKVNIIGDSNDDLEENLNIGNLMDSNNDLEMIDDESSSSLNDKKINLAEYKTNDNSQKSSSSENPNNKWIILEVENKKKKNKTRGSAYYDYEELRKAQNKEKLNNNKSEKEKEKEEKKLRGKKKSKKTSKEIKEKNKVDVCNFDDYFDLYLERILFFRDELKRAPNTQNYDINNSNDMLMLYKRKEKVNQMKKDIEFYIAKDKDITLLKEKIQGIINNKKNILKKLQEDLKIYDKKKEELIKKRKDSSYSLEKLQLLYDSLVYKKMAEICFVFFNKKCIIFFNEIPEFLKNTKITNIHLIATKRNEFYNDKEKKRKISSMMGYITYLMIYMSKCFDIPLRYPLWLNSSKSYILKGKKDINKDFIPLHCDLKKDDKLGNFEIGLNFLKNDFKEIINFCAMYPEIIPKDDYKKFIKQNEQNNVLNEQKDDLDKKMFFDYFIYFNHCLGEFIKNMQKMFAP